MEGKKKVVLAVNNSKHAEYAVKWAIGHLLNPKQHEVHLLCVVPPPIEPAYFFTASTAALYSATYMEDVYEKSIAEGSELLHHFRKKIEEAFNNEIKVEMVIGKGEARDEIIDYIEKIKADMLVLGTRGQGALKRTFLGSVSDYCVHHSHCPVVIVREKPE